ncbi:putative porin [Dysgonomonas sp. ZJ709]|uniref:putative porin n=1 Tax=Dysgonomonas sp. ZJ709 TaxID=2709797 RepID=UPI0013EB443A|nr:putative porin [Dysgonomonas sp. ZJ709]
MKKYVSIILLFFFISFGANAQEKKLEMALDSPAKQDSLKQKVDSTALRIASAYVWKITPRLGEREMTVRDSAAVDFHQSSLVDGKDVAVGYLGNIGSPAQSKIFFNRPETSRFTFLNGFDYWRKGPEDQLFLNTKIPYSNIYYQSGGGGERKEERLRTELSSNFGKKLNVGFNFDYLYARGFYNNLYNRQISYDFNASYIGDKYQMHAFIANNNYNNSENGGIRDTMYITNPNAESIKSTTFRGSSLDIPVRIQGGGLWNRLRGRHVYLTNRYNIGDDMEEYAVNDSVNRWRKKKDYIAPASVILTTHYNDQRRLLHANNTDMDDLYLNFKNINGDVADGPKYVGPMDDYMSYFSLKNTLALAMNEGFRSWMKFGLTAFIEYDMRRFSVPGSLPGLHDRYSEDAVFIGGVLSKEKGKYLRYRAVGEKDLLNSDFKLEGELTTMLNFKGRDMSAKATAYIKNITPSFFENRFSSKLWNWDTQFNDTKRVFIGGEIEVPFTKTKISGGVENITGYIYYGPNGLPAQRTGSVQVVALRIDQQLEKGIFHWDNQVVYQTTTDDEAIPLPSLSIYSNVYLKTRISKVLTLQLGADARFHTKYYAPGYEPLTMQFFNQRNQEIGNFPISTAYVNLHLKNTRFFLMMYNVAQGMGNSNYFSLYRYAVAPRVLKMGVSWNFNN